MQHTDRSGVPRNLLFRARPGLRRFGVAPAALVALALPQAALYWFGITARYPLAQGLATPGVSWPPFYPGSLGAGVRHALVYALLIVCYLAGLRVAQRTAGQRRSMAAIAGGWLLASLALLWAYPGESLDLLNYLYRGRMLFSLNASPLAITPDAVPAQPFYEYIGWRDWVDTYGPIWEYASGATAGTVWAAGGTSLIAYITGYRLLAIGMTGLCAVLIAALVRRDHPALVPVAVLAWLWNPLVLISTALGAHNDVVMLALVLLALLLVQRQRWVAGLLALWLAGHVKLTALLLVPLLGLWLVRRRGWRAAAAVSAGALVVAVPLSWLLYAPLGGWQTLPRMLRERTLLIYNSPANIVYGTLQQRWEWSEPAARQAVVVGSTLLFGLVALVLVVAFWRRSARATAGDATLWRACLAITMAYLLVGSFWFQSWYVLWALALAALVPRSAWTLWILPFYSLGALWSNLATDFLNHSQRVGALTVNWIMVVTLLTPMLFVLALMVAQRLFRAASTRSARHSGAAGARLLRSSGVAAALSAQKEK